MWVWEEAGFHDNIEDIRSLEMLMHDTIYEYIIKAYAKFADKHSTLLIPEMEEQIPISLLHTINKGYIRAFVWDYVAQISDECMNMNDGETLHYFNDAVAITYHAN